MESPLLSQTLRRFHAAIFRPSRPVSSAVARRARPFAHFRRPSTCSLINLLNGMKSFSYSATDRSGVGRGACPVEDARGYRDWLKCHRLPFAERQGTGAGLSSGPRR